MHVETVAQTLGCAAAAGAGFRIVSQPKPPAMTMERALYAGGALLAFGAASWLLGALLGPIAARKGWQPRKCHWVGLPLLMAGLMWTLPKLAGEGGIPIGGLAVTCTSWLAGYGCRRGAYPGWKWSGTNRQ